MTSRDFIFSLPKRISPEAIEGHETIFHFILEGEGGGAYTVHVHDNKVETIDGLSGDPSCVIRSSDKTFLSLIRGDLNPMMAVLTGKVQISNQGEMLRYARIFGLM